MWVPGHVGIRGNEDGDRTATEALVKKKQTIKPIADLMPFSDLKPLTAKDVYQIWRKEWDETVLVSNKFQEILPKLPNCYLFVIQGKKTLFQIDYIFVTLI